MKTLLALVAVAAGGGLFGYDASAPLDWRDHARLLPRLRHGARSTGKTGRV